MKNYRRLAVNNDGRELLVATEAQRIFPLSLPPPRPPAPCPREKVYTCTIYTRKHVHVNVLLLRPRLRALYWISRCSCRVLQFAARKIA